jgi:CheY-like chemotaxis protein
MDAETQSRIFTQFFTTKREGFGYGLGLFSAREVVSQHGGTISVQSAPGQGSIFSIELPLLDVDGGRSNSTGERQLARVPERPAFTRSVLLVDDEPMVRRSMGRLLRRAGFEVVEAASGTEALAEYTRRPHDLVLLDLKMPGMNGEATQQRLLALDADVKIVFATGHGDALRETALKARGALGVLEKPYTLDALFEILVGEPELEPPTRT